MEEENDESNTPSRIDLNQDCQYVIIEDIIGT